MNNSLTKSFSFFEWLGYLEKYYLNIKRSDIKDVVSIAKKLGILHFNTFVYVVGGTNGKGTTCFVLEKILLELGYRVGLYTSPHMFRYTERIRINGCELEHDLHVSSFIEIKNACSSLSLTYYDFITLSALYLFKHSKLDVIILEVGLGGRLDATNIINSDVSIITNIAIDHSNVLGTTRNVIGIEKSGIFRKNKIAIISERHIPNIVKGIIRKNKVYSKLINKDWFYKKYNTFWAFISRSSFFLDLPLPKVSLINTATALAAVTESISHIKKHVIKSCIDKVSLFGRCQILSYNPQVVLDVAHNFHATQFLSKKMIRIKGTGKIYAIIGVLKEKNVLSLVTPLLPIVDFWYCVRLNTHRSISAEKIIRYLPMHASRVCSNIKCAWKEVQNVVKAIDTILVFGSFFTVYEMCKVLKI
ncbi:MAG: bifunctional tetrahydrofolate synthase/dihydrofolate synthase [Buchnera aphidicola (Kaburagia rhusicola ensigallis)]